MCVAAATAMMVASTAVSVLGVIGQANAAQGQAQAQKNAAEYNATMAEYSAQDSERRAQQEAISIGRKGQAMQGAQRAGYAASGIDVSSGSARNVIGQTQILSKADQDTARYNGAMQAWSARAGGAQQQAAADNIDPGMTGATTLLAGAGKVASQWYDSGFFGKKAGADTTTAWVDGTTAALAATRK